MRVGMLSLWTIYFNPSDYPGLYVTRRFDIIRGSGPEPDETVFIGATLEGARRAIPTGATNVGREPDDEPQIVETWL
jgi:hypothetical protein